MKKGLMMAIAASTVLFAGGDIAPVQPVAEAPAAACNDFYGHVGAGVIYSDPNTAVDNDQTVTFGVAAVLGVTEEIFGGLTANVELQGSITKAKVGTADLGATVNRGNLTQMNLGYSFANTAIKVGRFSVDMGLSPLVFTDTNYFGLKDVTFDGVMVANTDLPDTVVYGAYIYRAAVHGVSTTSAAPLGNADGAVVLGFQNKSFADTTITGVGYYGVSTKDYALAGKVATKFGDTGVTLGGAYERVDATAATAFLVGGYVTQSFGSVDAMIAATYQNAAGTYVNNYGDLTWKTWQANSKSWAIGAKLSTTISGVKVAAWGKYREDKSYEAGASLGKTISGIALSTDVRYRHNGVADTNALRVRAKAVYKF